MGRCAAPLSTAEKVMTMDKSNHNHCIDCGDTFPAGRYALGYRTCLSCGQRDAVAARSSWCIAPIAHKQGATLVTDPAALKQINKYSND